MSRPAPKRRARVSAVASDTESAGGKRSARNQSTPRHARPGARRASRRPNLVPTPAVLGAAALVIAGGGAVVVSSNGGGSDDGYDPATAQSSLQTNTSYARGGLPISRSVSREVLQRQTKAQAGQLIAARAELAKRVQKRADELEANQWVLPVVGYTISAEWHDTSYLWSSGYHTGLDFSAPTGTDIVSVARGTVIEATWDDAYGNLVKVELEDGTAIWYAHQTSYVVEVGQEVNPGDLIGYVGDTGNTTGPHLHLEVRIPDGSEDGQDVDPYEALVEHGVTP